MIQKDITAHCVQSTFIAFTEYMTLGGVLSTQTHLVCRGPLLCNSWRKVVLCLPWWALTGLRFPSHQTTPDNWRVGCRPRHGQRAVPAQAFGCELMMPIWRELSMVVAPRGSGCNLTWGWHWCVAGPTFSLGCPFCEWVSWLWLVFLVSSFGVAT